MALSDTWLKANRGKNRASLEEHSDRDGLGVRVTPRGKITFQLRYRYGGTAKRLDLGTYPLMSLKEARAEAQRRKGQLEQGHDPKVVRLLEKQAILKADSVESLSGQGGPDEDLHPNHRRTAAQDEPGPFWACGEFVANPSRRGVRFDAMEGCCF